MKKNISLLIAVLVSTNIFAIKISGNIEPNEKIELHKLHLLTEAPQLLHATVADNDGNFDFEFDLEDQAGPRRLMLKTKITAKKIWVEAEGQYYFENKEGISLVKEENGKFNQELESLTAILRAINTRDLGGGKKPVATLEGLQEYRNLAKEQLLNKKYAAHLVYQVAYWEWVYLTFYKKSEQMERLADFEDFYFNNQQVYEQSSFYRKALVNYIAYRDIYGLVRTKASKLSIIQSLREVDLFKNEKLREIGVLMAFKYCYSSTRFPKDDIKKLNDLLEKEAYRFPNFKDWAAELKRYYNQAAPGSTFPKIQLPNALGELVGLEQYKGKKVLVDFWATWCKVCLIHMEKMPEIQEKHIENLAIVSISVDRNIELMNNFVQKKGYDWTFLYAGQNHPLLQELNITAYPTYFLLDEEGNILKIGDIDEMKRYF